MWNIFYIFWYEYYFLGLENLDQLVLNYNNLTKLDAKWFKGLDNLHDLKLCNNKIASINDDAFDGLEGKLNWHFMR